MKKTPIMMVTVALAAVILGLTGGTSRAQAATQTLGPYQPLKTWGKYRNAASTGKNALFSQPGYLRSARRIVSKRGMAQLGQSKSSKDIFYVYGAKVTSTGAVYYKVVTMDKRYRGYVYGGRKLNTFAKGLKQVKTTRKAAIPANAADHYFYIKDPVHTKFWSIPPYSWYGYAAGQGTVAQTLRVSERQDTFQIFEAATLVREGTLYYHLANVSRGTSGWVRADQVTDHATTIKATPENSLYIQYQTADHKMVKQAAYTLTDRDRLIHGRDANGNTQQIIITGMAKERISGSNVAQTVEQFAKAHVPAGYRLNEVVPKAGVLIGQPIPLTVVKQSAVTPKTSAFKVRFVAETSDGLVITHLSAKDFLGGYPKLTAADQRVFTGQTGQPVSLNQLKPFQRDGKLNVIPGRVLSTGQQLRYTFFGDVTEMASDLNTGRGRYGETIVAYYRVTSGPKLASKQLSGNTQYVF